MTGKIFGRTFVIFLVLAAASGITCIALRGSGAALQAMRGAADLLIFVLPLLFAGLLIGGLLNALIDRAWIERLFGTASGLRGLALATIGGMITPIGPYAAFPLVIALSKAGADIGTLVAFVTGWAIIGIHRVIIWEIPFIGFEFALLRFVVCLPMPFLSGHFARVIARNVRFAAQQPEDAD